MIDFVLHEVKGFWLDLEEDGIIRESLEFRSKEEADRFIEFNSGKSLNIILENYKTYEIKNEM